MYEQSLDLNMLDVAAQSSVAMSDAGVGPFLAFLGFFMVLGLVFYVYTAICYLYIAKRTNTPNGWLAFIPILNIVLMLQIAKKPLWWIILFFVPVVNIVMSIVVFLGVLEALKRPAWWIIMQVIPVVNLVFLGLMAWGKIDEMIPAQVVIPPTAQK